MTSLELLKPRLSNQELSSLNTFGVTAASASGGCVGGYIAFSVILRSVMPISANNLFVTYAFRDAKTKALVPVSGVLNTFF